MIRNYLKVALRNILKHKFFAAINLLGMSVGITACLLLIMFVKDELSYDRFHKDVDRIYQVGLHGKIGGQDIRVSNTCPPLAHALVAEVPEVEASTKVAQFFGEPTITYGDKSFVEPSVIYADSNFFEFFTFDLLKGDPKSVLKEPHSVVLTEESAKKYFGSEEAMGKLLAIGNNTTTYKVTGVVRRAPSNSHFHFQFILSSNSEDYLKSTVWLNNYLFTYLRMNRDATVAGVEKKIDQLVVKYVGPEIEKFMGTTLKQMQDNGGAYGFYLTKLTDIHLRSTSQGDIEPGGNLLYVYGFGMIAGFIIVIACINFMNMSTAQSAGRAKEVGLRKTLGSHRGQMIGQFLSESMIYALLAMTVSVIAAWALLPSFNTLAGKELSSASLWNPKFAIEIVGVILVVGLIAGSYPAFYLTSFKAVEVLKGKIRSGMKSQGVRSGLVVFQFWISIVLMISTVMVFNQLRYMQDRDIGFDKHHVLYVTNVGRLGTGQEAFRNSIRELAGVKTVSFTNNTFPGVNNTTVFKAAESEQDHIMGLFFTDEEMLDVMKFKMVQGRYFSKEFPSDSTAIVMNEAAIREFGWKDPLNETVIYKGDGTHEQRLRVIGVFRDFNFESLKSQVRPVAAMYSKTNGTLAVRYDGNPKYFVQSVETAWKKAASGAPFQFKFLDENFDELFRGEQRMSQLFTVFAGLAIFIACLGLFALAAFTAEQRTKEIGIRKAMGASVPSLTILISREFTVLVIIAFGLAVVPTWLGVNWWLQTFAYRAPIAIWAFVASGVAAVVVAWLTVAYQSLKAASTNPVTALRYE